ncbi:MAG: HAD family hydrolase, partial [Planctomycetes bacterium]|nr:HAD family hydrolase [Planctomycetota bacterium]
DPARVRLIPGAAGAVAAFNKANLPVVVITNQSGVARGFFPESRIIEVHRQVDVLLAQEGARIDGYFHCPHHPSEGEPPYRKKCDCRKPAPGLLLKAAEAMGLDLSRSFMIGDKRSDLEAGLRAGCRSILVMTGYGPRTAAEEFEAIQESERMEIADSLSAALTLIQDRLNR